MRIGDAFNPYKVFQGCFAPYWLLEYPDLSTGAKLCYIRLMGYAGKDGFCYPSTDTLAASLGISERQTRYYTQELIEKKFMESRRRGLGKTNSYRFLWHQAIEEKIANVSEEPDDDQGAPGGQGPNSLWPNRKPIADPDRQDIADQERQNIAAQERKDPAAPDGQDPAAIINSGLINSEGIIDHPVRSRSQKKRSTVQYGYQDREKLAKALESYMGKPPDAEIVGRVIAAANGKRVAWILRLLAMLWRKGYRPGTGSGPSNFAWFESVVSQRSQESGKPGDPGRATQSEEPSLPQTSSESRDRTERVSELTKPTLDEMMRLIPPENPVARA